MFTSQCIRNQRQRQTGARPSSRPTRGLMTYSLPRDPMFYNFNNLSEQCHQQEPNVQTYSNHDSLLTGSWWLKLGLELTGSRELWRKELTHSWSSPPLRLKLEEQHRPAWRTCLTADGTVSLPFSPSLGSWSGFSCTFWSHSSKREWGKER